MLIKDNPRFVLFLFEVVLLASFAAVLGPSSAYGLACGDEIRTDTVLTADLGPCPGNGLIVTASITLDLGGFTISGSGGGFGVWVPIGGTVTIQGPGTITNFGTGIRWQQSGPATVQRVSLTENLTGVELSRTSFPRVINNTISGGARGGRGIIISEVSGAKIKGNVITGHSGSGILIFTQVNTVIVLNSVTANGTGLDLQQPSDPSSITIRANDFSDNTQDGVSISRTFSNVTLDLNTINRNGRNGVSVSGQTIRPLLIGDNIVDSNAGQGIALTNIVTGAFGAIQVVDNEALGNTTDLFWDGTGTNNCWKLNIFGTSDPAMLPTCP